MSTFPDVETVLGDLLEQSFVPAGHTGTATPSDLANRLPFIRVNRYGGADNGITDQASVDVDCFALTRNAARDLAVAVHHFLIAGPHGGANIPLIDEVETSVGVVERPWPGGNVRRFGGSYTVSARRA